MHETQKVINLRMKAKLPVSPRITLEHVQISITNERHKHKTVASCWGRYKELQVKQ